MNKTFQQRWHDILYVKLSVIALFMLTLTNCTMYEINLTVDEDSDFSAYRTYAWLEDGQTVEGSFSIETNRLKSLIVAATEAELQQKYFTKASEQDADIYISYYALQRNIAYDDPQYRYTLTDINQNYAVKDIHYSSSFDASRRYAPSYERGVLVIDMIDRRNSRLVWRGLVQTPVSAAKTEEGQIERLNKAVSKLFNNFPPSGSH